MLEVVYPELVLDRARALRADAARAGALRQPRRPRAFPRRIAFWSGLALVRCGQFLQSMAAAPRPGATPSP